MRILIANYRYFFSGGPERYLFNITKTLEENGHTVVPFSVRHPLNEKTPHDQYFLSPLSSGSQVYFDELPKDFSVYRKMLQRAFWSPEARKNASRLARDEKIDVAYLMNFLRWMSPSIISAFKKLGIPVVVRVSDFIYLCPEGHFLRDGKVCELCKTGNHWHSVRHRCLQDSYAVSFANALAVSFHKLTGILDKVDVFVIPSRFTMEKMKEGGFPEEKLHHIPSFIFPFDDSPNTPAGRYILCFGRISREKGVSTLLDAFAGLGRKDVKLVFAGRSNDREAGALRERVAREKIAGVEFRDELQGIALQNLIRGSLFTVVPSVWYDNMPNTVLESYAAGKPVVASNLGSLAEIVEDGKTGLLFTPGDAAALGDKLMEMLDNASLTKELGEYALKRYFSDYTPQVHYGKLMALFERLTV